ncbi:hypothetical protein [Herbidospora galbida]|nr:hypothetical protein [Herbidospora galbida]
MKRERQRWFHFRHNWQDTERIGNVVVQHCLTCLKSRVRIR